MPANDYYDSTGAPSTGATISSSTLRTEFDAIETGFTAVQAALALKAAAADMTAALALKANATNAVLITPNIGTPSAGVVTNLTGTAAGVSIGGNAATATLASTVTTNANLTGHVTSTGNAAVLGSFTLAQLNTAISDADVATGGGTATGTNTGDNATNTQYSGLAASKANLASPTGTGTLTWPTIVGTDTTDATSSTAGALKTAGGLAVAKKAYVGTDLAIGGQLNLTGDLIKIRSESGADSLISMTNSSNTANSGVNFLAAVAGTSAGDAWSSYSVTGTAAWSVGIDNSDSDKFKISNFLSLGTNDYFIIDPATGLAEFPMGLKITGTPASPVDGNIVKSTVSGLVLRGVTGSGADFVLINAGGGTAIISNPTGTAHINMGGSFGRGAPITKTANFTVGVSENWLINNKAGSTCTVTLPTASAFPGREIMINNYQFHTVVSASSNVVPRAGGAAGTAILAATQGSWATLVSDGTNWVIMQGN